MSSTPATPNFHSRFRCRLLSAANGVLKPPTLIFPGDRLRRRWRLKPSKSCRKQPRSNRVPTPASSARHPRHNPGPERILVDSAPVGQEDRANMVPAADSDVLEWVLE